MRSLTMKSALLMIATMALAAGACGSNSGGTPPPPPATITFQLHNDGISTIYVYEGCQLDFTITSLADPVHTIALSAGCACTCGQACPVCGPCFEGALDLTVGDMMIAQWNTVDVATQQTPTGSCERTMPLPYGPYRIDVPVYPSHDDAVAKTSGRTASQTFTLPVTGNVVHVQLGESP
jgi:hypothetical protein